MYRLLLLAFPNGCAASSATTWRVVRSTASSGARVGRGPCTLLGERHSRRRDSWGGGANLGRRRDSSSGASAWNVEVVHARVRTRFEACGAAPRPPARRHDRRDRDAGARYRSERRDLLGGGRDPAAPASVRGARSARDDLGKAAGRGRARQLRRGGGLHGLGTDEHRLRFDGGVHALDRRSHGLWRAGAPQRWRGDAGVLRGVPRSGRCSGARSHPGKGSWAAIESPSSATACGCAASDRIPPSSAGRSCSTAFRTKWSVFFLRASNRPIRRSRSGRHWHSKARPQPFEPRLAQLLRVRDG